MLRARTLALVATVGLLLSATPASAAEVHEYLALGDSVAFGFDPTIVAAGGAPDPSNFVGYPEALATMLSLSLTNASCPGEASGGFISLASLLDNGCRGYRSVFPLHISYSSSQLDFAIAYVHAHPRAHLITIDLGANDLFLLQRACSGDSGCVLANLPSLLATLRGNLQTIYARLRDDGGFHGRLVALSYYALDYHDPAQVAVINAINGVVASVTTAQPAGSVADGFTAFAEESGPSGSPCAAGLLIRLSATTCDVHPSPAGRDVLARAIRAMVRAPGD